MEQREFGVTLSSFVLWIKFRSSFQCCWLGFPWLVLCCLRTVIWGGYVDFCFSRFKIHCDHFCFGSCIFFTSILFLYCVLTCVFFCNILRRLIFFFKVTMFLHYLWVGPLQAIAVTALLWMETGISCLAGISFSFCCCKAALGCGFHHSGK